MNKHKKQMNSRRITEESLTAFAQSLREEEKSKNTIEKYLRDVRRLETWLSGRPVTKENMIGYKEHLPESSRSMNSINSYIVSANKFLAFMGWSDLKVKVYRIQQETAQPEDRTLTLQEYKKLLDGAERTGDEFIYLILESLACTGMRISELRFLTAEAVREGVAVVNNKGKIRRILLTSQIQEHLKSYMKTHGISSGVIFLNSKGEAIGRGSVWRKMKKLCDEAGIDKRKVFPHNLRKLFATELYNSTKDIARVAEVLGHSSVETTRRYILPDYKTRRKELERLRLTGGGWRTKRQDEGDKPELAA